MPSNVASRRLKLAGHCARHPEDEVSKVIMWKPSQRRSNVGRRADAFEDNLKSDTRIENTHELKAAMMDRIVWRELTTLTRAYSAK